MSSITLNKKHFILIFLTCLSTIDFVAANDSISNRSIDDDFAFIQRNMNEAADNRQYIYISTTVNAKQTKFRPDQATIDKMTPKLKELDDLGRKTAIYYGYKFVNLKNKSADYDYTTEFNNYVLEMRRKFASSKVNVIMIIHIWVNKKGTATKLDEKTYLVANASKDVEETCITTIRNSMVAKLEGDKTLQPYYSNKALEYIANYLNTEIKKCKDGPAKGVDIIVSANGARFYEGEYIYYTSDLVMPKLKALINISNASSHSELRVKYKCSFFHQYTHDGKLITRSFSYSYPMTKDYYYVVKKPSGYIELDLSRHLMTGFASFEVYSSDYKTLIYKFYFRIGGKNPSSKEVLDYIKLKGYTTNYWFFENIVMGESGSKQFCPYDNNVNTKDFPIFGLPDGWGLMQIDQVGVPILTDYEYIFNWKKNIDKGYQVLESKLSSTNKHFKKMAGKIDNAVKLKYTVEEHEEITRGKVNYAHVKTQLTKLTADCNVKFTNNPSSNKSFIDGVLIKKYNGAASPVKKKDSVKDDNGEIELNNPDAGGVKITMDEAEYDIIRANAGGEYYFLYQNDKDKKIEWRINEYNNRGNNYVEHLSSY